MSKKVHCIYDVEISQLHSNIPKIIREASLKDPEYTFLWKQTNEALLKGEKSNFKINSNNILTFKKIIYVPNQISIKQLILDEFHKKLCVGHPRYQKLFSAIKKRYFWPELRKDVTEYLSKCLEC